MFLVMSDLLRDRQAVKENGSQASGVGATAAGSVGVQASVDIWVGVLSVFLVMAKLQYVCLVTADLGDRQVVGCGSVLGTLI